MLVEIPCEAYARMSVVPQNVTDEKLTQYPYVKSLVVERRNGHLFLLASNVYTIAVEYLGADDGPNETAAITVDPAMVAQATLEIAFNSKMTIQSADVLRFTTIKTSAGYNYPGNAFVSLPATNEFVKWREWLPTTTLKKSVGAMRWDLDDLQILCAASKTQHIRFPEFMDASGTIFFVDFHSPNWIAMFKACDKNANAAIPATIPEWCK